jgi:hypothetical protein
VSPINKPTNSRFSLPLRSGRLNRLLHRLISRGGSYHHVMIGTLRQGLCFNCFRTFCRPPTLKFFLKTPFTALPGRIYASVIEDSTASYNGVWYSEYAVEEQLMLNSQAKPLSAEEIQILKEAFDSYVSGFCSTVFEEC